MAQAQPQVKSGPTAETRGPATVPMVQLRGKPSQNPLAWTTEPFGLMRRLSDDMDQLFGQLIGGIGAANRGVLAVTSPVILAPPVDWMPALDVFEREGKLVVQADLPGVAADDVTVDVTDGILTVSGERREEREIDEGGFRRTERRYGKFSRNIALPEGARVEDIQAAYREGVLEITVPLPQQARQRRTIDVQYAPQNGHSDAATNSGAGKGEPAAGREAAAGGAKSDPTSSGA